MIKLLKWIFCPNWIVVWSDDAQWECYYGDRYEGPQNCFYSVMYSIERNKYKLTCSGHRPKQHRFYAVALETMSKFQLDMLRKMNL